MQIQRFREYCSRKEAVTEEMPFDDAHLVFKVAGRTFALTDVDNFSFVNLKCEPAWAKELRDRYEGIRPGYHMNKRHWITVETGEAIDDAFWEELIEHSYNRVLDKMPKKWRHTIRTAEHVRSVLEGEGTGHDWWHIHRVRKLALHIADKEGGDRYIVELAALLHDIADWKFYGGDEQAAPNAAAEWLGSIGLPEKDIQHIRSIIEGVTFKGSGVPTPMESLEGKIVQDADRLDALGAIGIGRAFAYGGSKERPLHDPLYEPQNHTSFEAYKKNDAPTIAHFYEKLLLLKDRMNTETGAAIAKKRHAFMEDFLRKFFEEWEARSS